MEFTFWFIVFTLSWLIWVASDISLARRGAADEKADRGTFNRIMVAIGLAIAVLMVFDQVVDFGNIPLDSDLLFAIGAPIIWSGFMIRQWAIRSLGGFFTVEVKTQPGQKVIRSGPYSIVRHPAYLGTMVSLLGLGIGLGNLAGLALASAIVFMAMAKRIDVEENVLLGEFGKEYADYAKRTKKLLPFIY